MTLAFSPASNQPTELEPAPLLLPWDLRLTPEQFERVCQANPEVVLELAADGAVLVLTPTGGETGSRNSRLLIQLGIALICCKLGLRIFDSSTGFRLPDRSPCSVPMPPCCWKCAGRPSPLCSAKASRPCAPIWWWSWPGPLMRARAGSAPFAS